MWLSISSLIHNPTMARSKQTALQNNLHKSSVEPIKKLGKVAENPKSFIGYLLIMPQKFSYY